MNDKVILIAQDEEFEYLVIRYLPKRGKRERKLIPAS